MISSTSIRNNRFSVIRITPFLVSKVKLGAKLVFVLFFFSFHARATPPVLSNKDLPVDKSTFEIEELDKVSTSSSVLVTQPNITVRFANPQYDCGLDEYCVDVEFQSDEPDWELYVMNVAFHYDDNLLEFIDFRDFQGTYGPISPNPPTNSYLSIGVPWFNFSTGSDIIQGSIQRLGTNNPVFISTTGWTKLFQVCFSVDDPVDQDNFCPSLVWDLEADPSLGSFIPGSEGVVMTVIAGEQSENVMEHVDQFNWQYIGDGAPPFGEPIEETCISVNCGTCSLVVSSTDDSGPGTLREKIECATSGDTITFATGMGGQTITINSTRLIINKNLYIRSNLSNRVKITSTIAGLFEVSPTKTAEFKDLDITSGLTLTSNGGAAFRNSGILRLLGVKVFKNPSLPTGQYLIRNITGSQLLLFGDCFIEIP